MPISFTLVERTPYRLKYLALCDGIPEPGFPWTVGLIHNRGVGTVSPDLRGDAAGLGNTPILQLVSKPMPTTPDAQKYFQGQGLTSPSDIEVPRASVYITPRSPFEFGVAATPAVISCGWAVFPITGAAGGDALSTGFGCLQVFSQAQTDAEAYIELALHHTFVR